MKSIGQRNTFYYSIIHKIWNPSKCTSKIIVLNIGHYLHIEILFSLKRKGNTVTCENMAKPGRH
jgi:hypothetical protein